MEGLSPWELATLKVVYHRSDQGRKGFLNVDDIVQLCKNLGVNITEEESSNLFKEMDDNNDGRISFSELMTKICTDNEGRVQDMQLRAAMLNQTALVATGAAIPLILKGKTMIVLGTLFYDPVRLFRDFYVDYAQGLKARVKSGGGKSVVKEDVQSLMDGIKKGFKAGSKIRTAALVVLAISVDCAVGALVFLVYAKVRSQLQRTAQEKFVQMQKQEDEELKRKWRSSQNHHHQHQIASDNETDPDNDIIIFEHNPIDHIDHNALKKSTELVAASSSLSSQAEPKAVRKRMNRAEICLLEATSGAVAGAFAGLLTPLAKRVVDRDLFWPDAGIAGRTYLRIRHGMSAHAAFFSGFYFFRSYFAEVAYKKLKFQSTSFHDAIVTTAAGCCAGGCWKVASDPLKNRDDWVAKNSIEMWRKLSFNARLSIRTQGLGKALAQTMPVTGVAFLFYEASFAYFM